MSIFKTISILISFWLVGRAAAKQFGLMNGLVIIAAVYLLTPDKFWRKSHV